MAVVGWQMRNVICNGGNLYEVRHCAPQKKTTRAILDFMVSTKMDDQEADMVPWANILQFFQSDDRCPVYTQTSSTQRQQMKQMEPSLDIYREAKLHAPITADTAFRDSRASAPLVSGGRRVS